MILLKLICNLNKNIIKIFWLIFLSIIFFFFFIFLLNPNKLLSPTNYIISKILELDNKTYFYGYESKLLKLEIVQYEEEANKLKRKIKELIYSDIYMGILSNYFK